MTKICLETNNDMADLFTMITGWFTKGPIIVEVRRLKQLSAPLHDDIGEAARHFNAAVDTEDQTDDGDADQASSFASDELDIKNHKVIEASIDGRTLSEKKINWQTPFRKLLLSALQFKSAENLIALGVPGLLPGRVKHKTYLEAYNISLSQLQSKNAWKAIGILATILNVSVVLTICPNGGQDYRLIRHN